MSQTSRSALTRRSLIAAAGAGAASLSMPSVLRAQSATIKVGVLHPVTGALAFSGGQARAGALLAIEDINAAGGIRSMGGMKLEPILADAQSQPQVGAAEVEKLNEAGVSAIIGPFASGIALATTQSAARHNIPHIVDVGVVDQIVNRNLANVFRFAPGFGQITSDAIANLEKINDAAGKPCKTVMIVHEESAFGSGMAKLLGEELPKRGFQILETISHPTPHRDFSNIVLRIRSRNPDIVIPSNYFNEYILFARALRQQRVTPKAIYSVLGGAASNFQFLKENPEAAQYIMDCNHWYDARKAGSAALRRKAEAKNLAFTYELFLNYSCVGLLADALERARSSDRAAVTQALATSTWDGHIMPYGPTRFVNGQNMGARAMNTQILADDIKVVYPPEFATAPVVFPRPRA